MLKQMSTFPAHRLLSFVLFQLMVIGVFIVVCAFLLTTQKDPPYFQLTPNKQTVEMSALKQPVVSADALLSWATMAATQAYSINFQEYEKNLKQSRAYFTQAGYNNFIAALNADNTLADIQQNRLIVSAVPVGPPVILREGIFKGNYSWQIQVPLLVNYETGAKTDGSTKNYIVNLFVTRVSTQEAPQGLGITQLTTQAGLFS